MCLILLSLETVRAIQITCNYKEQCKLNVAVGALLLLMEREERLCWISRTYPGKFQRPWFFSIGIVQLPCFQGYEDPRAKFLKGVENK